MKQITGDIISLAIEGKFDLIPHGCNCFNTQGAGLAEQMSRRLNTHLMKMEQEQYKGDPNKLGTIDYTWILSTVTGYLPNNLVNVGEFIVVNAYTQYKGGANADYTYIRCCLKKINLLFPHLRIGIPLIGCGIGGLDEAVFLKLVEEDLKDCKDVTIVRYG